MIVIALGSNLGDRLATLTAAVQRLRAEPGLRVTAVSQWYETPPVGGPAGQGPYLNGVVLAESARSPAELLALLQRIEAQFGRVRSVQDGPRTLDLDLLVHGNTVSDTPTLTLPHPRIHERGFVLFPLAEVAGDAKHPTLGKSYQTLLDALPVAAKAGIAPYQQPPSKFAPRLAGLRVFVTGSTAGIGAAMATQFEAEGATVLRHGRRERDDANYLRGDLADADFVTALPQLAWDKLGGLDVVVLNAGADTLTGEAAGWSFERKLQELLTVDLTSTMLLGRAFGARMKAQGSGVILTIGWDQAETGMEGDSGQLFTAVKAGIMAFTRSLALSLAPEVRVNCLAPGWVRTAWGETASEVWQERVRRETPLGIWGLPEDLATAAVWLASPEAKFITGQTLRLNGGAVR
jgi:3-oxoacyl-[acyl-carrier protein] reductase